MMLASSNIKMSMAEMKRMEIIAKQGSEKKNIKMIGRSLFLFTKENCLRKICYHIVSHSWYDSVVLFLIAVSTVLLTLDNPNMDDKGQLAHVLGIFDYVLTTLFTLECLLNIILLGLVCNGKSSYAKDSWNIMDLIIVIFSLLTIVLQG